MTNVRMSYANMQNPIVIIGAGYGGLCVAIELAKQRGALGREIILIDRNDHFLYTPLLYEVATGYDPRETGMVVEHEVEKEFAKGTAVPYEQIVGRRGIRFLSGEVTGIDWKTSEIILNGERRQPWSQLVLALGGETDFYDIPGLREQACQLKTLRQALAIRRKLRGVLLRKERGEQPNVSVVVGGAGATGVEFTAELMNFFETAIDCGKISPGDVTVTVVEAGNRILPMFDPTFSAWATSRFKRWGVRIHLDTCIQSVTPEMVTLVPRPLAEGETLWQLMCEFRTEKQRDIRADVVIWTGGVRGPSKFTEWELPCDRKGRVEVNEFGEVKGLENVLAVGDCATLINPKTNQPVPALVQTAMAQGHTVAANIAAAILAREKRAFPFPYLHTLIPLGGKHALANVSGFLFHGFFAWVVRQLADLRYFSHILPVSQALQLWWRGLRMFGRND